jgi:riboflavin kinase/FMN adenylyltransferase
LIEKLNTRKVIIGYDHRFGRNQEGGIGYLEEHQNRFGFEVEEIPHQDIHDVTVSSTKIREALQEGEVHVANEYLGRYYSLSGLVTKGEQVGRKIGFPTANIYVPETYKLIPGDGVYAVKVKIDDNVFNGMLNIGNRPTVMGQKRRIEVDIFNVEQDIYGLKIEVDFVEQLRKEQRFDNLQLLKRQLEEDKKNATKILSEI